MSDEIILLTEKEKQQVRDFTMKASALSDHEPNIILTIEGDTVLLGLDVPYPREGRSIDTAYFVEFPYSKFIDKEMVFAVLMEIRRIALERWAELQADEGKQP